MRPPVETPSMKSPRLRVSKVPVKHAETSRISSLSRGLVPFMVFYKPAVISPVCLKSLTSQLELTQYWQKSRDSRPVVLWNLGVSWTHPIFIAVFRAIGDETVQNPSGIWVYRLLPKLTIFGFAMKTVKLFCFVRKS